MILPDELSDILRARGLFTWMMKHGFLVQDGFISYGQSLSEFLSLKLLAFVEQRRS